MNTRDLLGFARKRTNISWTPKKALDKLQGYGGLETLVRKLNEWGYEQILRVQLTGSNLRVTGDNFPTIHEQVYRPPRSWTCRKFLKYIAAGGINAFTFGVERPILVLTSGAVDCLGEDELFFVIARELGHVKSAHVLYSDMAGFIPVIGDIVGGMTLGFGEFSAGTAARLAQLEAHVGIHCGSRRLARLPGRERRH